MQVYLGPRECVPNDISIDLSVLEGTQTDTPTTFTVCSVCTVLTMKFAEVFKKQQFITVLHFILKFSVTVHRFETEK